MSNEWIQLFDKIRDIVLSARRNAARSVNTTHVVANFEIGRLIVEHEQAGAERAEYGKKVLVNLSRDLTSEFGRGFSKRNLENMRRFFLEYRERLPRKEAVCAKAQEASDIPDSPAIAQTPSAQFKNTFALTWSHYVFLMAIDQRDERQFYEIEAEENSWSLSELKRQYNSGFYERLAMSRDKDKIRELARRGQIIEKPLDLIKQPYVLEFLGLEEESAYSENDLETAIIDKIEHFLLELGKGFLFEARQKRFTFGVDHFYIDLVFYNRLLRCYVLIDLKIGRLTHQDLGQMQMYVNYFDRYVKLEDENPSIGIVLCRMKEDALVELTLPENANIFASKYQLYLPSKEELRQKLLEWTKESDV